MNASIPIGPAGHSAWRAATFAAARVALVMVCVPWACHSSGPAARACPQSAALSRVEVRLARIEARLADVAMQAQMAEAGRAGLALAPLPSPESSPPPGGAATTTQAAAGARALAAGDTALAQGLFAQALGLAAPHSQDAARALMGLADTALVQGAQGVAVHHLERLIASTPDGTCTREAAAKLARLQGRAAAQSVPLPTQSAQVAAALLASRLSAPAPAP